MSKFNIDNVDTHIKENVSTFKENYGKYAHLQLSGVYGIKNNITNKLYIGSSTLISARIVKHFSECKLNKHTNKLFQDEYNLYGIENYSVILLKETTVNLLQEEYNIQLSYDKSILYNETIGGIPSEKRKVQLSLQSKSFIRDDNYRKKLSESKTKYKIAQLTFTGEVIEIFDNTNDIITKYPDYNTQTIRGVCNGSKRSYKNFNWQYIDKDDITNFTANVINKNKNCVTVIGIHIITNEKVRFESITEAANFINVTKSCVSNCCNKNNNNPNNKYVSGDYIWNYEDIV